jgi:hypothetical protein
MMLPPQVCHTAIIHTTRLVTPPVNSSILEHGPTRTRSQLTPACSTGASSSWASLAQDAG